MKKAQLQIQESMLVIFIFVVLLLVGLVFFYQYTTKSIQNDIQDYENFQFQELISIIPSMAEFRCSVLTNNIECIDLSKVIVFNRLNLNYFDEFGYKNISLVIVYPEEHKNFQIYYKKPLRYKNTRKISTPVSVYDVNDDKFKVGKLIIEWYS